LKFIETPLEGAFVIELEPIEDDRGFFARSYCKMEFEKHGIHCNFVQTNISHNCHKGTLRGMHYQKAPHEEEKLISCIKGSIYDVIIDIRPNSNTYHQWYAVELDENSKRMIFVPKGFAHGFQALTDDVELLYCHSAFFHDEAQGGLDPRDQKLAIEWPLEITELSDRDIHHPRIDETFAGVVI